MVYPTLSCKTGEESTPTFLHFKDKALILSGSKDNCLGCVLAGFKIFGNARMTLL